VSPEQSYRARVVGGTLAWPVTSCISTVVYLTFVGFEIALAEVLRPGSKEAEESTEDVGSSPEP
jgi:hypothetical protein